MKSSLHVLLSTFFIGLSAWSWGQKITGKVFDNANKPVSGVVVIETATQQGVATDLGGNYALSVKAGEHTIRFEMVGFIAQSRVVRVDAGQTVTLDIQMEQDEAMLADLVVIGYGVQRKRDVTGSITSIEGKDIANVPTPSFEAALQGRGAGIQVSQGSGLAGSGSLVRIRGISSISAGGDPLYVVDGIPITQNPFLRGNSGAMNNNPLTFLNPNDIESIEVLKDAAATGIYGSRGANGVILITTKRGKNKGLSVDLTVRMGTSQVASKPNMMNTEEYLTMRQEAWENDGGTGYAWLPGLSSSSDDPATRETKFLEAMKTNTNWFDELTQVGLKQSYNVGLNYVAKGMRLFGSLGSDDNGSYIVGNRFVRNSARFNGDFQLGSRVQYSIGLSYTQSVNHRVDAAWSGGIGEAMSTALPYFPVYDTAGNYFMWNNGYSNPAAYRDLRKWINLDRRTIIN
ncbi:MAG: TonB-dependent receptor plug domain-containing protein, partial [Flavobacteriales bacterium]